MMIEMAAPLPSRLVNSMLVHPSKWKIRPYIRSTLTSSKHRRTAVGELHISPAFVPPQTAQLDRAGERGAELSRYAARVEERTVDQFDVDAPVLHGLDRAGDLNQPASVGIGIGEGGWFRRISWSHRRYPACWRGSSRQKPSPASQGPALRSMPPEPRLGFKRVGVTLGRAENIDGDRPQPWSG